MSTKIHDDRYVFSYSYFHVALAVDMSGVKDESAVNFALEQKLSQSVLMLETGHGTMAIPKRGRIDCCVCQLEKQFSLLK